MIFALYPFWYCNFNLHSISIKHIANYKIVEAPNDTVQWNKNNSDDYSVY